MIILFLLARSNDYSRMLSSVFTVVPSAEPSATGWGRVAHSLSSGLNACVVCEVQMVLFVSAVQQSVLKRVSEEEESFLILSCPSSVSSFCVNFIIILLLSDYLTHVFMCHLSKHVCALNTTLVKLVCEIAAAGKRFKLCMG